MNVFLITFIFISFLFINIFKGKKTFLFVCLAMARVKSYSTDQKLFCHLLYDSFWNKIISVGY